MNPLARELNKIIKEENVYIYEMLSDVGKNLFFPKGILSQSAEAKKNAYKFNATIGMATEDGKTMYLSPIMDMLNNLEPQEALTYAPSFGIMPLRQNWKSAIFTKNPSLADKQISMPVVTNAITHGLSVVADMWVNPGDVIILPEKMWGNYNLIFSVRRGAQIINYELFNEEGEFNLAAFQSCVREESKKHDKIIIILNFPNNPTGYSVTPKEADKIVEILVEISRDGTNVLAITDDAYFGLFYNESVLKESVFARMMGRDPRLLAIKLDGSTKEDYVWGLRVGFITYGATFSGGSEKIYEALEKKTAGAVRGSISNVSHLSQEIMLKAFRSKVYDSQKQEKFNILKARAMKVKQVLKDPKYQSVWEPYPFNSGYFMCLCLKTVDAEPLRKHLLAKYGIGLIALGKTDLRVAFSCLEEGDIQELFDTLFKAIRDLNS